MNERILCHRGLWCEGYAKNSLESMLKAFESGYGVELDIRNEGSKLVVGHDINDITWELEDLFKEYKNNQSSNTIALNIKSDGMARHLKKLIEKYEIANYFVFDMSIPETVSYIREDLKWFARISDIEEIPKSFRENFSIKGIWLDSFYGSYPDHRKVIEILENCSLPVCIVSPELHSRKINEKYKQYFDVLKRSIGERCLLICTDTPSVYNQI